MVGTSRTKKHKCARNVWGTPKGKWQEMVSAGLRRQKGRGTQNLFSGYRKVPQSDLLRYGSQKDNVHGATEMN